MPKKTTKPTKPTKKPVAKQRADFGASITGFLAKQPAPQRAILDALRALIAEAAPEATPALKWGNPFFSIGSSMMCAMSSHKSHVNLILPGPDGTYADPDGRLEGEGKTGKHLALRSVDELPRAAVKRWLATAAARARAGTPMGK